MLILGNMVILQLFKQFCLTFCVTTSVQTTKVIFSILFIKRFIFFTFTIVTFIDTVTIWLISSVLILYVSCPVPRTLAITLENVPCRLKACFSRSSLSPNFSLHYKLRRLYLKLLIIWPKYNFSIFNCLEQLSSGFSSLQYFGILQCRSPWDVNHTFLTLLGASLFYLPKTISSSHAVRPANSNFDHPRL